MNETDCVLQGKRLLCILQIKKKKKKSASVKGIYLPDPAVMWRRQEINMADDIFPESLSRKSQDKDWLLSTNPRPRQAQGKVDSNMPTGAGGSPAACCSISICNSKATAMVWAAFTEWQDQLSAIAFDRQKSQLPLGTCDFRAKLEQIPIAKFWAFNSSCVNLVRLFLPSSLDLPGRDLSMGFNSYGTVMNQVVGETIMTSIFPLLVYGWIDKFK